MTRNQQMLMLMTWALPFHGLSPENARDIAGRVLDYFDGDLADVDPAEAIHRYFYEYYKSSQEEGLEPVGAPRWEDYGFVRPPVLETGTSVSLSDGTSVVANNLAFALSNAEVEMPKAPPGENFTGAMPDGSLVLASGGEVPPLPSEDREKVWVAVFSDPTNIDQDGIDALVENPPPLPENPTVLEQKCMECYNSVMQVAAEQAIMINEELSAMQDGHDHSHHSH